MNGPQYIEECQWPSLASPYQEALYTAVAYVLTRFSVLGIVVSGSIIRGNPGPTSDLDLCVLHAQPQRQRLQRLFHGVPAEIFVNPPSMVRRYFESEHNEGRPCTAHMFVTGVPVLVLDPVVDALRAEAHTWLQKTPTLSAQNRLGRRYGIVDLLDNARDLLGNDPECAARILHQAVEGILEYAFLSQGRFLPRSKELIAKLQELDSELMQLTRAYYQANDVQTQMGLAETLARRTIGATEFFEWESEVETV